MNNQPEEYVPSGYASMMDALKRPDDWDVPGMIADICENLQRENDEPHGHLLAVIDTLMFRMRDIADLIAEENAKRVLPGSVQEAWQIAQVFRGQTAKEKMESLVQHVHADLSREVQSGEL